MKRKTVMVTYKNDKDKEDEQYYKSVLARFKKRFPHACDDIVNLGNPLPPRMLLAKLLSTPSYTMAAATLCRPVLLPMVCDIVDDVLDADTTYNKDDLSIALIYLLLIAPHTESQVIRFFSSQDDDNNEQKKHTEELYAEAILLGMRHSSRLRSMFARKWPNRLLPMLYDKHLYVRWCGIKCLSLALVGIDSDTFTQPMMQRLLSSNVDNETARRTCHLRWQNACAAIALEKSAMYYPLNALDKKNSAGFDDENGDDDDDGSLDTLSSLTPRKRKYQEHYEDHRNNTARRHYLSFPVVAASPTIGSDDVDDHGTARQVTIELQIPLEGISTNDDGTQCLPDAHATTTPAASTTTIVKTKSMQNNIASVILSLLHRDVDASTMILLEGPSSSGKTTLLRYLAQQLAVSSINGEPADGTTTRRSDESTTAQTISTIHLDDQTDSKTLLGTYICTCKPGEFVWQPGLLTQAVTRGSWVVIENIHHASAEVLAALLPLIERRTLHIPSRGEEIVAARGFQLFATAHPSSYHGRAKEMLGGLIHTIRMSEAPPQEQVEIVSKMFPHLAPLVPFAIESIDAVMHAGSNNSNSNSNSNNSGTMKSAVSLRSSTNGCAFSFRDVLKWARRMHSLHEGLISRSLSSISSKIDSLSSIPIEVREAGWMEASDCLCGGLNDPDVALYLQLILADVWAVPHSFVEQHTGLAKPVIARGKNNDGLYIGRAFVSLASMSASKSSQEQHAAARPKKNSFAQTGHAMRLMERVAVAACQKEPVLLVGETGTGKTTLVQEIAKQVDAKLVVVNLSQQTDSSDLIGGFRPLQPADALVSLLQQFIDLVRKTWKKGNNEEFLDKVIKMARKRRWQNLGKAYESAASKALSSLARAVAVDDDAHVSSRKQKKTSQQSSVEPSKNTNFDRQKQQEIQDLWKAFAIKVQDAVATAQAAEGGFAFGFFEGALVQAVREGWWLLLDEVNLAPAEALERISGLLEDDGGSITLAERGDFTAIEKHPNFRLFTAMNPATDAGKKDLPAALRRKFTEIWVGEPQQREDLSAIVASHLIPVSAAAPVDAVVDFYIQAKEALDQSLQDGAGHKPTYNLRTLSRSLEYAAATTSVYGMQRALYDGFAMSFLTQLDLGSSAIMESLLQKHFLGTNKAQIKAIMNSSPPAPSDNCVLFDHYWVEIGSDPVAERRESDGKGGVFISTPTVTQHLRNLARAVLLRKYPILLQGPTSSGKTSLVAYLAAQTGHHFVRINNHEQTDLQEYLGTYISDEQGRLVFQEGLLVQAVRHGHWIVLDELNLAPTEVLEALNRLLDDNRELFVPELQEVVKPHPHFMLFATQNPPGLYAGRKTLSRAFRSRFLELHVDDIPDNELHVILEKRCAIAPSYASKLVEVMRELQRRRALSNVFAGRHGFITPRDLFRWAGRGAVGYDQLAQDGYAVLGERLRSQVERDTVQHVLEKVLKTKIDMQALYDAFLSDNLKLDDPELVQEVGKIVWTSGFRRMYWLLDRCLENSEPALLIGETGIGKTSVCQLAAFVREKRLRIINCNQHTESSDFLGGYRPNRNREQSMSCFRENMQAFNDIASTNSLQNVELESNTAVELMRTVQAAHDLCSTANMEIAPGLRALANEMERYAAAYRAPFEWVDGPLVTAMKQGEIILIDEVNLAEDAVLERLNSVLESTRTLTLAEKGGADVEVIVAHPDFRVVATMNPGGDYGKKELSPALANRFTTIWVPTVEDMPELQAILDSRLQQKNLQQIITPRLLEFWAFFRDEISPSARQVLSIRDLLTWIEFINSIAAIDPLVIYAHGAHVAFIDGIGMGVGLSDDVVASLKLRCHEFLLSQLPASLHSTIHAACELSEGVAQVATTETQWGLSPFFVERNQIDVDALGSPFDFNSPTTAHNTFRVLRAMQLRKPILLEGSPGVGKTSLIAAIAKAVGRRFVRINLSEQTDMMDLLGADLPTEGGSAGEFAWSDGPLLQAIKLGAWVLLDELNLANQTVLEGLNALLDHRAEVFIPELNKTVKCTKGFRIFGAQNPLQEGGGRKGLPKSFLNRFSRVHVELLRKDDLLFIASMLYRCIPQEILSGMVDCLHVLQQDARQLQGFGSLGGPWEFNLRDLLRWCELIASHTQNTMDDVDYAVVARHFADILLIARMRTKEDRLHIDATLNSFLGSKKIAIVDSFRVTPESVVIGAASLPRSTENVSSGGSSQHALSNSTSLLEAVAQCVSQQWMCILVGPPSSGKTATVRSLANLCGRNLLELPLNSGTDTSDLLGGFEQVDIIRKRQILVNSLQLLLANLVALAIEYEQLTSSLPKLGDMASFWSSRDKEKPTASASYAKICLEELEQLIISIPDEMRRQSVVRLAAKVRQHVDAVFATGDEVDGRFEWVDGSLTRAIIEGQWVVLDNANLCNPSVLDRLNPLLEPHGVLYLNECGTGIHGPRLITPHPDFRLFLSFDSKYGEISRAMRNRGLEVFLLPDPSCGLAAPTWLGDVPVPQQELHQILGIESLPGHELPSTMLTIHNAVYAAALKCHRHPPSVRELKRWAGMIHSLCSRGVDISIALSLSFEQIYVQVESDADARSAVQKIFAASTIGPRIEQHALFQPLCWPFPLTIEAFAAESAFAVVLRDLSPVLQWLGHTSMTAFGSADTTASQSLQHRFSSEHARLVSVHGLASSTLLPGSIISQLFLGLHSRLVDSKSGHDSSSCLLLQAAFDVYQERALHDSRYISFAESLLQQCSLVIQGFFEDGYDHLDVYWFVQGALYSLQAFSCHPCREMLAALDGAVSSPLIKCVQEAIGASVILQRVSRASNTAGNDNDNTLLKLSQWRYEHVKSRAQIATPHPGIDWFWPLFTAIKELEDALLQPAIVAHLVSGDASSILLIEKLACFQEERWSFLYLLQIDTAISSASSFRDHIETLVFTWMRLCKSIRDLSTLLLSSSFGQALSETIDMVRQVASQIDASFDLDADASPPPLLWKFGGKPALPATQVDADTFRALNKLSSCMVCHHDGFPVDNKTIVQCVSTALNTCENGRVDIPSVVAIDDDDEYYDDDLLKKKERLSLTVAAAVTCDIALRDQILQGICLFLAHIHLKDILQDNTRDTNKSSRHSDNTLNPAHEAVSDILQRLDMAIKETALQYAGALLLDNDMPSAPRVADAGVLHRVLLPAELLTSPSSIEYQRQLLSVADADCNRLLLHTLAANCVDKDANNEHRRFQSMLSLLVAAPSYAASLSPDTNISDEGKQQIVLLQQAADAIVASGCRSINDGVPYRLLSWMLDALTDDDATITEGDDVSTLAISTLEWRRAFQQSLAHEAWFSWLHGLWNGAASRDEFISFLDGPMQLHRCTLAAFMPAFTRESHVPLHDRPLKLLQIQIAGQQMQEKASAFGSVKKMHSDVVVSEWHAAVILCASTLSAHFVHASGEVLNALHQLYAAACIPPFPIVEEDAIARMLHILHCGVQEVDHPVLTRTWAAHILPALELLFTDDAVDQGTRGLQCRGQAYTFLGLARLYLCIPPAGTDPATSYALLRRHILSISSARIVPEIHIREQYASLPGGPSQLETLLSLCERLASIEDHASRLDGISPPRPMPPQYMSLRDDVVRYVNGLAAEERVLGISRGVLCGDARALQEATQWIENASSLVGRLSEQYSGYGDIIQPVQVAIHEIQYGLGLSIGACTMIQQRQREDIDLLQNIARQLVSFPRPLLKDSIRLEASNVRRVVAEKARTNLSHETSDVERKESAVVMTRLRVLRAGLHDSHRDMILATTKNARIAALSRLQSIFKSFLDVWEDIKAEEARREAEENELYKTKTRSTTVFSEEEEDEADFKTQFPDQFAAFADLAGSDDEDMGVQDYNNGSKKDGKGSGAVDQQEEESVSASAAFSAKNFLFGAVLQDLISVYTSVFSDSKNTGSDSITFIQNKAISTTSASDSEYASRSFLPGYDTGMELIQNTWSYFSSDLDDDTATGHLYALATSARRLTLQTTAGDGGAAADKGVIDIQQPQAEEALFVQAPLELVQKRISQLLAEWPDHPVLTQLQAIAARVLSMPVTSPLKALLTGVELLLARARVWEETAAKHVSISAELRSVAAVATRWRKIELSSWRTLVQRTTKSVADNAHRSWFHLYRILFVGDSSAESVASALEDFVQLSPLGEYQSRLVLISSFYKQLVLLCSVDIATDNSNDAGDNVGEGADEKERMRQLSNVLYNICKYYLQFLPAVQTAIARGLAPHEKDLKDFVALAKWEDRGFYAMKASTEKAQRHLHRLCRRAAVVVQEPTRSVLAAAAKNMSMQDLATPEILPSLAGLSQSIPAGSRDGMAKKKSSLKNMENEFEMHGRAVIDTLIASTDSIPPLHVAKGDTSALSGSIITAGKYTQQLPALAHRFSKIVRGALQDQSSALHLSALSADELAGDAADRAVQLRQDVAKGAKARKKKALVDLLHTLSDAKISKLRSAVPADHRGIQSWFSQSATLLEPLLNAPSNATTPQQCDAAVGAWLKADAYHYASMARLQRLFEAASHPSTDLLPGEVDAACRMSEHLFYLTQYGRSSLTKACNAYAQLDGLVSLLTAENCFEDVPEQYDACQKCTACQRMLPELVALVSETKELLMASSEIPSSISRQSKEAVAFLDTVQHQLQHCIDNINAHVKKSVHLAPSSSSPDSSGTIFITRSLSILVENAFEILHSTKEALAMSPYAAQQPGWPRLVAAFESILESTTIPAVSFSPDTISSAELLQQIAVDVENVIESSLLWAQSVLDAPSAKKEEKKPIGEGEKGEKLEEEEERVDPLPLAVQQASRRLAVPRLEQVLENSSRAFKTLALLTQSKDIEAVSSASRLLAATAPLLREMHATFWHLAARTLALHRCLAKLTYVMSALFAGVVEEGFCMPEGEEGEPQEGKEEIMQGTGLGDGDTRDAKDITDELEDQDQLLGAQQKDQQEQQQQENDQAMPDQDQDAAKGVEMDDDFEGVLEDMKRDNDDDQERKDESDDEEGDDDRIEQQMGDAGDEAEDVDERLWNDKEEEDTPAKEEAGHDKDTTVKVDDASKLEYAPGQNEDDNDEDEDGQRDAKQEAVEAPQQQQKEEGDEDIAEDEDEPHGEGEDEDLGDYQDRPEDRGYIRPEIPEEEMQLPDDLNLDGDEADVEEEEEEEGNDGDDREELVKDGAFPEQKEKEENDDLNEENGVNNEIRADNGAEMEQQEAEDEEKEEEEEEEGEKDAERGGGIAEEADDNDNNNNEDDKGEEDTQMIDAEEEAKEHAQDEAQGDGDKGFAATAMAPQGLDLAGGAADDAKDDDMHAEEHADGHQTNKEEEGASQPPPMPSNGTAAGAVDGLQDDTSAAAAAQRSSRGDDGRSQSAPDQHRDANPFRNLGSAMERWKARLNMAMDAPQQQQQEGQQDGPSHPDDAQNNNGEEDVATDGEFRFLGHEEQPRVGDTQALASATADQATMHGSEDGGDRDQHVPSDDDGDDDGANAVVDDQDQEMPQSEPQDAPPAAALVSGQATWAPGAGEKAGLQQQDAKDAGKSDIGDDAPNGSDDDRDNDGQDDAGKDNVDEEKDIDGIVASKLQATRLEDDIQEVTAPLTSERADALRTELDGRLRAASDGAVAEGDMSHGHAVWSRCEALTAGLVGELTEQLRLILEPTSATKMGGEYRTGKRINMKKVIGYIASHFRKDKIWMRRTKPDKRTYQVLIAVDDSRSMAETGCGSFALEAVTLISKAMARLEVGEMGIVSFGGSGGAEPLHALDRPFTDVDGIRVMSRMRFDQDNTIGDQPMVDVITSVDHLLEGAAARASNSAAAGGSALHQLVLIIADGRFHEKEALKRAARDAASRPGVLYAFIILDNAANSILDMQSVSFEGGKPVFTKYIDTFPFPFYMVLRDTAALPRTLADLLRQWFELSSG